MTSPRFKHAAFTRHEVDDARRGRPAVDLSAYAAARGLQHTVEGPPAHLEAVAPSWPEYSFNAMQGVLPGGARGAVVHELMEVEISTSTSSPYLGGKLYDVRTLMWDPPFWHPDYWRGPKNEPFAGNAIWIPTTRFVAQVPGAALLPQTMVVRNDRLDLMGRDSAAPFGLPGFGFSDGEQLPDAAAVERILRGPAGQVLAGLHTAYVELGWRAGYVSLRVNGFVGDSVSLDHLCGAFSMVVEGVRRACAGGLDPRPSTDPLPAPLWVDRAHLPSTHLDMHTSPWWEAWRLAAAELGLVLEDPVAFHQAFPDSVMPGVACAVMRAQSDGLRLLLHRGPPALVVRGGALVPVSAEWAGPRERPVWVSETGMWAQAVGDQLYLWTQTFAPQGVVPSGLLELARASSAALGAPRPAERSSAR